MAPRMDEDHEQGPEKGPHHHLESKFSNNSEPNEVRSNEIKRKKPKKRKKRKSGL